MEAAMRLALAAIVAAVLSTACAGDPYPLPARAETSNLAQSAAVGKPVTAVLVYVEVRPGDRIELLGAEPIGSTEGSTVRFLLSRPVTKAGGEAVIGEAFERLEGAEVTASMASAGPGNTIGIAAELTGQRPGRFELTSVRLRYRLNGGPERVGEGADVAWLVCADDPAPPSCETEPAESPVDL
jgi:hypothetical protein